MINGVLLEYYLTDCFVIDPVAAIIRKVTLVHVGWKPLPLGKCMSLATEIAETAILPGWSPLLTAATPSGI